MIEAFLLQTHYYTSLLSKTREILFGANALNFTNVRDFYNL